MTKSIQFSKRNERAIPQMDSILKQASMLIDALMNGDYVLGIEEEKQKRTPSQNSLFHVWVAVFADYIGYESREECKKDIKRFFLGMRERVNRITGEIENDDFETSKMSTKELSDFMDRFKVWALTEYNCYLPYWKDAGYDEMIAEYKHNK
jgi:hypothetical protein